MIDSNIRGLYKRIEYQIANLKGLFSKNEKQMIDNVNEIKRDNEDFKDSQKYIFDTHKADVNNPHKVTKSQIGLVNVDNVKQAPAEEFNNHVNSKNNPHAVTKTQVGLGNVDNIRQASKAELDIHIEDKTLHTTEAEKNKWNAAQLFRITSFEGSGKFHVGNTDDLHEKVALYNGFVYFTSSSNAINGPGAALRGLWISASDAKYGTIMGYDNANRTWLKTYVDGVWSKWERLLTDVDLNSTWNQVTLVAGTTTKHFAGNPLQFSIRQNSLHLRGSFEGIPANGAVIARFTQKPSATTVFGGQTVGSNGSACFTLGVDGSLKFDGMDSADNSKVMRVEINEHIPLW